MAKIERILVPVDFSASSKAAIQYAQFLASKVGASLDILHVANPSEVRGDDDVAILTRGVPGSTMEVYNEHLIQEKLNAFVKEAGLGRTVRNDEIEEGKDSAELICKVAKERGYDLIVMGVRGRKGLERLLGTVTQKVSSSAPCPVLTCRGEG